MRASLLALSVLLPSLVAGPAAAAEQTVLGRAMVVKDPFPGVNPFRRLIKVVANERGTNDVFDGNPLVDDATLEVIVNGATSSSQTFTLPAGPPVQKVGPGWRGKASPGAYAVWSYKDKNGQASPVTRAKIVWRSGESFKIALKVDAQANNAPVDVVPGNPTTDLGIRLTFGAGDTYCVLFGGAAGGLLADRPDGTFAKAARPTGEGCPVAP